MAFNYNQHYHNANQANLNGSSGPNSGGPGQEANPQDLFRNMNPEMIKFGLSAGQDILNKQRDRFMPGMSGLWNSLKIYFSVSAHH
jgi:hypothetical protein